MSLFIEIV